MTRILLTGAGFSRNWGGWLANEVFEYLLGSEHVNDRLRSVLWEAKESQRGFEDVLADLQRAFETRFDPQTEEDLRNLTTATNTMFAEMSKGYEQTNYFDEPVVSSKRVSAFLAKFDA